MKTIPFKRRRPDNVVRANRNAVALTLVLAASAFFAHAATAPKIKVNDSPLPRDNRPAVSFAPIVKQVSANVVNIYTKKNRLTDRTAAVPCFKARPPDRTFDLIQ
jgi:S1-C subfamily serine protease